MQDKKIILIKYGGNAMLNQGLKKNILLQILKITQKGHQVVLVHGGGPFIQQGLDKASVKSEFIDGHRKTTEEAISIVEQVLKGEVNADLNRLANTIGLKAVGLSGIDSNMVIAKQRHHFSKAEKGLKIDLGHVGDVDKVDPTLLMLLLKSGYFPIVTCISQDSDGKVYNVNGDMFAGHLAASIAADEYLVLTDVNGLYEDFENKDSLISNLSLNKLKLKLANGEIHGGMIPKLDSCAIALEKGCKKARIINGTKPELLSQVLENEELGTTIIK